MWYILLPPLPPQVYSPTIIFKDMSPHKVTYSPSAHLENSVNLLWPLLDFLTLFNILSLFTYTSPCFAWTPEPPAWELLCLAVRFPFLVLLISLAPIVSRSLSWPRELKTHSHDSLACCPAFFALLVYHRTLLMIDNTQVLVYGMNDKDNWIHKWLPTKVQEYYWGPPSDTTLASFLTPLSLLT